MSETRFAWLLETTVDSRPAWFKDKHLHSGRPEYTFDANEAKQWATKEEAEAANKSPFHKYTATEHGFG